MKKIVKTNRFFSLKEIHEMLFNNVKVKTVNVVFTFKEKIKNNRFSLKLPVPVKRNIKIISFLKNNSDDDIKIKNNIFYIKDLKSFSCCRKKLINFNLVFVDNYSFFFLKKSYFGKILERKNLMPQKQDYNISDNIKDIDLIKKGYYFSFTNNKNIVQTIVSKTNFLYNDFLLNFNFIKESVINNFCNKKKCFRNIFFSDSNSESFNLEDVNK